MLFARNEILRAKIYMTLRLFQPPKQNQREYRIIFDQFCTTITKGYILFTYCQMSKELLYTLSISALYANRLYVVRIQTIISKIDILYVHTNPIRQTYCYARLDERSNVSYLLYSRKPFDGQSKYVFPRASRFGAPCLPTCSNGFL